MRGLWINNAFVDSSTDDVLSVVDPAAEEVVEEVQAGGAADVNRAVQAAHAAAPGWRRTPAVERAALLRHVAERLREQREELARLLTRETGRTLIKNRGYVDFSADAFAFYAELGRNERGRVVASPEPTQLSLVLHEPHGVVACIVPWNYPLLLLSWKVAPALAAGNTVVIKPVTQAPLTTLKLAECLTTCRPACEAVLRRGASRQHRDQRPASGQRSRAIWRFQIERRRP
jgi:acyl-CoA reductase-like NAD-dependent aldehyde dehydrogenase